MRDTADTKSGARFTDMGDGTVRDNDTGLTWLKNANAFGTMNWSDAMDEAATLSSGEHGLTDGSVDGDWRLPTIDEWEALVDTAYSDPALCNADGDGQWAEGDAFTEVQSFMYWSSTEIDSVTALGVRIDFGIRDANYKDRNDISVWPVRSGN